MAGYTIEVLKFTFILILKCNLVVTCKSNHSSVWPEYCDNESVTCRSQLVSFPNALDCMIEAPGACSTWTFSTTFATQPASVKLIALPHCLESHGFAVIKLLLKDIKWTTLWFRYTEYQNGSRTFCRRFTVSSQHSIPELFYDCRWTDDHDHYKTFVFEYEAQMESHKEGGKYWFKLPGYGELDLTDKTDLSQWSPFLYVDVSESPTLTVRWLQAPKTFGVQKYELKVYDRDELKETEVFIGTGEEEMSYTYSEYFSTNGQYKFEVRVLNDYCKNGTCPASESPVIIVGVSAKKVLAVVTIGSLVFMCLLMAILYSWKKCKLTKNIKPPKLLIIYTQSSASHIKVVEELAKYLRKYCFVDALLDQLDIPKTQSKDPYEWYNDAFAHLDFVMVVSSPPKCCGQGLYRGVDIIALNFLKAKFSDRCHFFSALLPYCTELDIPNEAKHFQKFRLTKDLDKMLWFIHNGGKFPAFMESACALLGPKLHGGESDFKVTGVDLLKAMKQAEDDLLKVCCHKNLKDEGNYASENTRFQLLIPPVQDVTKSSPKLVQQSKDVSKMNPDVGMNCEDLMGISLDDLDLTGADTLYPEPLSKQRDATQAACDLDTLAL